MHRVAGFLIAALFILPGSAWWCGTASAKPRPQFWQSDDIVVRVLDLPDTAMFKRGYRDYVDLGYHFREDGTGSWVGHVTDGRRETLTTIRLGMMLAAAGKDRLPPVPSRPASSATYLFFFANGLAQLGLLLRIMMNHHLEFRQTNLRKKKSLLKRRSASQTKASKDAKQASRNSAGQGTVPATDFDAVPAAATAQRGIAGTAMHAPEFGRRGW